MGRLTRRLVAAAAVGIFLLTAGAPMAGRADDEGDSSRDEEARNLFQAGRVAFSDGRYDDAMGYFRRAYELSGRPELLYNVGTTADRLRRTDEAVEAFETFLAEVPESPNRREVESRIAILKQDIEEREAREEEEARRAAEDAQRARSAEAEPPPEYGPFEGRRFTWVALGLSAVTAGLATYFWVDARNTHDDLAAGCGSTGGCTREEINASGGPRSLTLSRAFLGISLAALAGSVVLYFLEDPSRKARSRTDRDLTWGVGPGSFVLEKRF
jgi:tetratricopeptide (TPR) repeat protein